MSIPAPSAGVKQPRAAARRPTSPQVPNEFGPSSAPMPAESGSGPRDAVPRLADFPATIEFAVRWSDMDALGHVNNARYFTYFEQARVAYFERLAQAVPGRRPAFGTILVSTRCDFLRPLAYPEVVVVGAKVREVRTTSLSMDYAIFGGPDREVCAVGSAVIVVYDYEKKVKVPVPPDLRARIEAVERREASDRRE